ncbi:MAG: adenylate kinase [Chlamydiota bacterium]|jgi:adenylate kinase
MSFVIILLGPPGSGKGTHAALLSETLQIPHISTGDLFRLHIRNRTSIGSVAKELIDQGKLVPDDVVVKMVNSRIQDKDCARGFVLDGFPRTVPQAKTFAQQLSKDTSLIAVQLVIDDAVLVERITGRLVCAQCAKPYHQRFSPPATVGRCDACQGALYQRDDDSEAVLRLRLATYHVETKPVIDYYRDQKLLVELNAERSKEAIFQDLLQHCPFAPEPAVNLSR